MALTPASFERELQPIRDALSIRETEETWDAIARAVSSLQKIICSHADTMSGECVQALRLLGPSVNRAVTSERSRLSGVAIDLVGAVATELGDAFEPLLPVFIPTLLNLCARPNKVFVTRARNCVFTIIQATGSANILTPLARHSSDKSISLRLAVAEATLACLNNVDPPELRKESRAREVEEIIKHAGRDASAEIRKVGRQIFEAYSLLLPHRVDSFVAPLTPTIKKYLAVSTRPSSRLQSNPPSRPSSSQSTRSATEMTRATSPNPFASRPRSDSTTDPTLAKRGALKVGDPQRAGPTRSHSANIDLVRPRTLSREAIPPQRPRSQAEISRPVDRSMAPPSIVPSRPQRDPTPSSERPANTKDPSTSTPKELPRSRTGPIRPTTPSDLFAPVASSQLPDAQKRVGGARRVLRSESAESSSSKKPSEPDQDVRPTAAKRAPPQPVRSVTGPARVTSEKHETKEKIDKKPEVATKAEGSKPAVTKSQSTTTVDRLTKPTASQRAKAQPVLNPNINVRQRTKSAVPSDRPGQRGGAFKPVSGGKKAVTQRHTPTVDPAKVPLPRTPSPVDPVPRVSTPPPPETSPCPTPQPATPPLATPPRATPSPPHPEPSPTPSPQNASPEPSPSSLPIPSVVVNPTTPENTTPRPRMVEQTPISALFDSIQQGFIFTPRDPNASMLTPRHPDMSCMAIPEEDEDAAEAEEVAFFTGQPLVWNRKPLVGE